VNTPLQRRAAFEQNAFDRSVLSVNHCGAPRASKELFCSLSRSQSSSQLRIARLAQFERVRISVTPFAPQPQAANAIRIQPLGGDILGSAVLSGVAGYVDTAGFMALFGLFTAHITGDLVTAGTTFTNPFTFGTEARLIMVPVFMISVAVTTLFARVIRRKGNAPLPPMLTLMTAALALFCLTGVTLRPLADKPDTWATLVIGGAGVVAMGVQNTLMRNALSSCSPTTIMTGNLTQCTIDLVNLVLASEEGEASEEAILRHAAVHNLKKFGFPLLGFMIGTILGAWLTHCRGLESILLPTAAMAIMSAFAWRDALKPRAVTGASPGSGSHPLREVCLSLQVPQCDGKGAALPEQGWGVTRTEPYSHNSGTFIALAKRQAKP